MRKIIFIIILLFMLMPVYAISEVSITIGASANDATVFVYPDYKPYDDFFADADEMKIVVYTFTDWRVADLLIDKDVTLMVEKSPAGGIKDKGILCYLDDNGVDVYLYDGPARFMHAKYFISGDEILVGTENVGSSLNRGWGVIAGGAIVNEYNEIFRNDLSESKKLSDVIDCDEINIERNDNHKESRMYFEPKQYKDQEIRTIFSPDSLDEILSVIDDAEEFVYVQQFYIYKNWDSDVSPLLQALIEKSEQGLTVRVLLDSTWYNEEKNGETIAFLNDLDIEAKFIEDGYFEKSHVKGIVTDKAVVVSSINWNENSVMNNREAGLIIEGEASQYFKNIFMNDWYGYYETNTGNKVITTGLITGSNVLYGGLFVLVVIVIGLITKKSFSVRRRRN
ncbi:phospholipase D-like domain-containing protein [Candidatus Aenigmatarchaeota archaeon]